MEFHWVQLLWLLDKINIASFGNLLPQVHWHIMARFETDSYFPEPMWGQKQRACSMAC
jgi:diadenosine tetraphosphate (Ap4A) HIT family hydrolase